MAEYSNRSFALNLGGARIASESVDGKINRPLRITFSIELDTSPEPNTAEVAVYNLREETRALVAKKGIPTTLEAGYSTRSSLIFAGKLEYGSTVREGPDWVTRFQSTDGAQETRKARINLSFKPGVDVREVMRRAAESMGVNIGNTIDKIKAGNIRGALQEFGNGIVLSGPARAQFDKIAKTLGYNWSIQNGEIQVLEPDGVIDPAEAVLLSPRTGLIGTPQTGEDGKIECRSLLSPSLTPGRLVRIEAREIQGFYRIDRAVFSGDSRGASWYADLEVKPR